MTQIKNDPRTYAIIGAAMEVGFLEAVYHEALAIELSARGIPCRSQVDLPVFYEGHPLATSYRADLLCYDGIVVELKPSQTERHGSSADHELP